MIIVAELNDDIIGVLHMIFYPNILLGGYDSQVSFLLVDKGHRRKGVGSMLLKKAIDRAKEKGTLEMHVDTIYPEAERFYRKRGFKDGGIMLELTPQSHKKHADI